MPPTGGQDESHNAMARAEPAIGILGWAALLLRLICWLLLLALIAPLAVVWRLFGLRRFWPQVYFRAFCAILGLRIRVHGQALGNALYLPNHISWMDIPALLATTGSAFVAKDDLAGSAIFRFLAALNDTVFIARDQRSTVSTQVEYVRQAVAGDGALTIFIEGTTGDGTGLLPFKSALLSALEPLPEGLIVQPVLLRYAEGPRIAWVGEEPGAANIKRMLGRFRPIRLDLHFLDPLAGDALLNRKTMAGAARDAIAARMALG